MDTRKNMFIAKGEIVTHQVASARVDDTTNRVEVQFTSGKTYTYMKDNIHWLRNPVVINTSGMKILRGGKPLFQVSEVYEFHDGDTPYWHIRCQNEYKISCPKSDLSISKSCLSDKNAKDVLAYMRDVAGQNELVSEDGTKLLPKQYEKIDFIDDQYALACFLNPQSYPMKHNPNVQPIFPFGCNQSQYQAVQNALSNQISIIQGPPGTGKTQTILNIISNLLLVGKTVQVVSNNNSAIENVLEKMAAPEYGLDFIVALLGNSENKAEFISQQKGEYPISLHEWDATGANDDSSIIFLKAQYEKVQRIYQIRTFIAETRKELSALRTELRHFEQYLASSVLELVEPNRRKKLPSQVYLLLWDKARKNLEAGRKLSLFFRIWSWIQYGLSGRHFYRQDMHSIIHQFQRLFYLSKEEELLAAIADYENDINHLLEQVHPEELTRKSLEYVKATLKKKYSEKDSRPIFNEEDLWKNPQTIQDEYPVVLSTTYSARSSLGRNAEFDYVIIDEASQVDVATGVLALSCAQNAVIVGDNNQLPNIIKNADVEKYRSIFAKYRIDSGYDFATNSFLQSIAAVITSAPVTLLREHYRCHPKIINFCNQKFYDNQLIIMTEDAGEQDCITLITTVPGSHERDRVNQRQIDVLREEVLPMIFFPHSDIGIIAPYRNQVQVMHEAFTTSELDIATIHKFQGREKDVMVISTVDNVVTKFSDDPNLLNVAISRAKKQLYLIVSGEEQPAGSNIADLIEYIRYHNVELKSKVYSVFDYLYKHYDNQRRAYLKSRKRISQYDSENLIHALIEDVLKGNEYRTISTICHFPLRQLIRDYLQIPVKTATHSG
jgi:uncharacterized short protein YbdD (DUF466 family)